MKSSDFFITCPCIECLFIINMARFRIKPQFTHLCMLRWCHLPQDYNDKFSENKENHKNVKQESRQAVLVIHYTLDSFIFLGSNIHGLRKTFILLILDFVVLPNTSNKLKENL